jgi:hypothetical protein
LDPLSIPANKEDAKKIIAELLETQKHRYVSKITQIIRLSCSMTRRLIQ